MHECAVEREGQRGAVRAWTVAWRLQISL